MYCSSCGMSVAQGLSYCNYCGAKLNVKKDDRVTKSSELKPEALIQGIAAVFVCGLVAIIGLMAVMKSVLDFGLGLIVAFTLLSFLIMLMVESVFISLLVRRTRSTEQAGDAAASKGRAANDLDTARALPEPVPSVTEHTTRAFDPVYSERKSG